MPDEVPGGGAPVLDAIASLSRETLWRFLRAQRWFAAKGSAGDDVPSTLKLSSPIVLPWGDGHFAIARLSVDVNGATQTYQLPIAVRGEAPDGAPSTAKIGSTHDGRVVFDAAYDPEFRKGLAAAITDGASAVVDGSRLAITPVSKARAQSGRPSSTRLGSGEQSNTSMIVDDVAVIKLFRLLTAGEHPDAEIGEFLTTRAEFANTPPLLARMQLDDDGVITTTGIASVYMPKSTDAWAFALEVSRPYFAAPRDRDVDNAFVAPARRLGEITRRMHEALGSSADHPDFAPEPATDEDVERWADRTHDSIHHALGLLETQLANGRVPKANLGEAGVLVKRRDDYLAWVEEKADGLDDDLGMRTRIHGDFHLGQVLRTADEDFMIIDFEGEPSKSLEERREKTSPLRDVAGLLRSIGYAAATLTSSVAKSIDLPTREVRSGRWERDVRDAYLSGYLETSDAHDSELLPADPANVQRLLALFEADKAFYELAYELNNRPDWAWIPMRGIAKLLAR